ncbi:Phosphatidylinositol-specific phospholipase C, X domain protein [Dictyocaulus viviparus]|uniref:Phosphoinositide phospholipase C n=1 Tax=Dictyocaulus viviparus TaxID=29172 RepID=A0A0D8Y0R9_DICVI|nr:Phosphatidylinositol-specific phospholipase C, X domain protein [Dictyocaulus viviparus]
MNPTGNLVVPSEFIKGNKFLLLDNQTRKDFELFQESLKTARCPKIITLRIDPNGHILYWLPRIGQMVNYIFIQDIVDVRTGKPAAITCVSLKEICSSVELLMTVVDNVDFIHPNYTTFVCLEKNQKILKMWAEYLFQLSTTIRRRHFGVLYHIQKNLAPLCIKAALAPSIMNSVSGITLTRFRSSSVEGNTYIKSKMSDRGLVEMVLSMGEARGLKLVFEDLCDNGEKTISRKKFLRILQTFQRDPRLNESLYPPITDMAMDVLLKNIGCPPGDNISFETFVHYLWSDFCLDSPNITEEQGINLVTDMMHEPLSHYYINSSHNTYCIGLQVRGAQLLASSTHKETIADVEIYRQVLLSGCRCVELDCWDGSDGPVVTHGPSAVMRMNEIPLREICTAIAESAFKTSPYPVLLSIENHLSQQQQKKMVQIFRDAFGTKLLVDPLETHPLVEDQPLPSPNALKYKILIKAKKAKSTKTERRNQHQSEDNMAEISADSFDQGDHIRKASDTLLNSIEIAMITEDVGERQLCPETEENTSRDLSRIVNYLCADKVPRIWNTERRLYLMCSMSEDASIKIYKDQTQRHANNLIKHTSKRLVRVFPANTRITSDNFLPNLHWMMGIQIVALNFQTNSPELLVNHAMFDQTGRCGYVKKPKCLCDPSLNFDIYANEVPQRMPITLKVKIISSLFLPIVEGSPESWSYMVTIDLLDLPPYDRISGYRIYSTDTIGVHTHFEPNQAVFDKIILSETAFLQLVVYRRTANGSPAPLAYRVLSLNRLNNGYRHVILRSSGNQNLGPLSLFIFFDIFYYVVKTQIALHSALMNPFSRVKKEDSLSMPFKNPFIKQDEIDEEEDDYRQAIVGTTKKLTNSVVVPNTPPSLFDVSSGNKATK